MKQNEDGKTVRAMDVLFPKIGEIIGGSERESDYNKLMTRIEEIKLFHICTILVNTLIHLSVTNIKISFIKIAI